MSVRGYARSGRRERVGMVWGLIIGLGLRLCRRARPRPPSKAWASSIGWPVRRPTGRLLCAWIEY